MYTQFVRGHKTQIRMEPECPIDIKHFTNSLPDEQLFYDNKEENVLWYDCDSLEENIKLTFIIYENAVIASVPISTCNAKELKNYVKDLMIEGFNESFHYKYEYKLQLHNIFTFEDIISILDVDVLESPSGMNISAQFQTNKWKISWFDDNVIHIHDSEKLFTVELVNEFCSLINQNIRQQIGRPPKSAKEPIFPYDWSLPLIHIFGDELVDSVLKEYSQLNDEIAGSKSLEIATNLSVYDDQIMNEFFVGNVILAVIDCVIYTLTDTLTNKERKQYINSIDDSILYPIYKKQKETNENLTQELFIDYIDSTNYFKEILSEFEYYEEIAHNYHKSENTTKINKGDIWLYKHSHHKKDCFSVQIIHKHTPSAISNISFNPWIGRIVWQEKRSNDKTIDVSIGDKILIDPHLLQEKIEENTDTDVSISKINKQYNN